MSMLRIQMVNNNVKSYNQNARYVNDLGFKVRITGNLSGERVDITSEHLITYL